MSFLKDMINPPPVNNDPIMYKYNNGMYTTLSALRYLKNTSLVMNANFATLGSNGATPITQSNGDNAQFSASWQVFGASNADYTITPTAYPSNSTIQSASGYYINLQITSLTLPGFYFYQQVPKTARAFQNDNFVYGLYFTNNGSGNLSIRADMYCYYDTENNLVTGKQVSLPPGQSSMSGQLMTQSLQGKTVGANDYTEFRLNFLDLGSSGSANIDIYLLKFEQGIISTPL